MKQGKENPSLQIIEIYSSVQGETSLTGLPTTFIRLARCNLRCSWCDTPHAFGRGEPRALDAILDAVAKAGCRYVCVTGGEPLLQKNVLPLLTCLCDRGYTVSLETGGSLTIADVDPRVRTILDIKCPGSDMSNKNLWSNLEILRPDDEVKFVIKDQADFQYSVDVCNEYRLFTRKKEVLYSPVHGILDPKDLIAWILKDNLPARLNLQIHKYVWSPATVGV